MPSGDAKRLDVCEEDVLRADLYDLLAALLVRAPQLDLIDRVAGLSGDGTPLGEAIGTLARIARSATHKSVEREYNALFIGLARGELLPYASYYLTGFLHEKPLALLRADMGRLGIARSPDLREPEDSIGALCEMMAGLIRGRFGAPASLTVQKDFFAAHLGSWGGHFFADLEGAQGSVFYAPVGRIGRVFMEIEREAFRMGA